MNHRMDEIPVSDRIDEAVRRGLEKAVLFRRKRIMKKSLAAAASLALLFTSFFIWGFSNSVLASQIPFIGHIFAQNEKNLSFPGNYSSKAEPLETETTEKTEVYHASAAGYTFSADEIYCDGASVYLGMTVYKEDGFGHIPEYATERFGKTEAQSIDIFCAEITVYTEQKTKEAANLFITNEHIEGTQTDDTTFEGILKIDLADNILPQNQELFLDINIASIFCMDDSTDTPGRDNPNAGWLISSIPFTIDSKDVKIYPINDINADGFGIGTVIVTPYEVKVETILPPLYKTQEELISAKREIAGEEGKEMTDKEIDEYVDLIPFGNYGGALFDASGYALEYQNAVESKDGNSQINTYSVKNGDTSVLYFYIGPGDIESVKETDQSAMESRAVYRYVIDTNENK